MMWKTLAIQNLLFLLFFHPGFLVFRRIRYLLLLFSLTISVFLWRYRSMDPFAWLFYASAILLTYWTANKALRWVFVSREFAEKESRRLLGKGGEVKEKIARKEDKIHGLQGEIQRVSEVYESVKEMSGSLEYLDLFINVSNALMKNFSLNKTRLLLLKKRHHKGVTVDKVFEADPARCASLLAGKGMMTKEQLFGGEKYPSDTKLAEQISASNKPVYSGSGGAGRAGKKQESRGQAARPEKVVAFPVETQGNVEAVLVIEGVEESDVNGILILADRFLSEFRRIHLYEDVQRLATTDWLTGLFVRRYFFKRLEEEINRCERFNLKFSFLMIDIDDFKVYNDRYGHLVGDALLKQTVLLIKQNVREADLVARYGGEEFAAILLDTDADGAMYVGQRIRKSVEKEPFKVYDEEIMLTVSVGVATYSSKIKEGSQVVEWADSALYQAKRQGKNRVCAFVN